MLFPLNRSVVSSFTRNNLEAIKHFEPNLKIAHLVVGGWNMEIFFPGIIVSKYGNI